MTPRVSFLERVTKAQRPDFEKRYNHSIMQMDADYHQSLRLQNSSEFAPIIYASNELVSIILVDLMAFEVINKTLQMSRDTDLVTMSAPDQYLGVWRAGTYLPYFGDKDMSQASVEARRAQCLGWIGVSLEVERVFATVLARYQDDVNMDAAVVYVPRDPNDMLKNYNCTRFPHYCELSVYDPHGRHREKSTATIPWEYGFQQFELRCYAVRSVRLYALRNVIAWPILMIVVVLLCSVIVYLALKKMQAIEKNVSQVEKINSDLRAAKVAAESADEAKSRFLATVSHEIR